MRRLKFFIYNIDPNNGQYVGVKTEQQRKQSFSAQTAPSIN